MIRTMSRDNPLWGAPRIHGELLKLGIAVSEASVSKYMVRHCNPPSQTWRTFLEHHVKTIVSVEFFTVPTIRFQVLYVFLVLAHDRSDSSLRGYSPPSVVLANPEVADKLGVAFLPSIPLFASVGGDGGGFPGILSQSCGASV